MELKYLIFFKERISVISVMGVSNNSNDFFSEELLV